MKSDANTAELTSKIETLTQENSKLEAERNQLSKKLVKFFAFKIYSCLHLLFQKIPQKSSSPSEEMSIPFGKIKIQDIIFV